MSVFQDCLDSYLDSNNIQVTQDDGGKIEVRRKQKISEQIEEISKDNNNICLTGSSDKNKLCMKYQGNFKIIKF